MKALELIRRWPKPGPALVVSYRLRGRRLSGLALAERVARTR